MARTYSTTSVSFQELSEFLQKKILKEVSLDPRLSYDGKNFFCEDEEMCLCVDQNGRNYYIEDDMGEARYQVA